MSPVPRKKLRKGVLLVVEQLRREVPGGIGTYARGLVGALARLSSSGANRVPITLFASKPSERPDPLAELGLPLKTSVLPSKALVATWSSGLISQHHYEGLVHGVSLACPVRVSPLVVTVHDLCWRRFPELYPRHGRRWHEAALQRVAYTADAIVVPSEEVCEELLACEYAIKAGRVTVIEEGADHLPAPDEAGADALLARLGVCSLFVLSVSTLEPRKNLARLAEAYGRCRRELHGATLLVVGPVGWGEAMGPLPEGVVLAGEVSAAVLAALYRRALLFAYVPLAEGYGLPVVEAMAAGIPVVSSAVPSAKGASLLVEATDPVSIAEGLVAAGTDEGARSLLVQRGSARVADLTWERAALAHLELWARVAKEWTGRAPTRARTGLSRSSRNGW